ncbi:hypothetical protein [Desulfovibrio sp. Fe33]|uniref:hypothetical protein n=1 Tax=Desulfovibrio sp. Fe33 TaxID=3020842 RepID=UPI00234DB6DA|nr:hypothetical protein [Desulfovibrio sp. Fe33]
MRKAFPLLIVLAVLFATSASAADGFPKSIAGFTLGEPMERYGQYCRMEQALPVSDAPFLSEVLIKPDALPGVRGGSLAFGNCRNKDRLVRVKLKFNDRGQGFFDKLYERYEDAFGEPDKYLGDAFKNVIAWEWFFRNDKGEQISLVLMWSRDKEIRPGVSIKMTYGSLMDEEYECYMAGFEGAPNGPGKSVIRSLDTYVPR